MGLSKNSNFIEIFYRMDSLREVNQLQLIGRPTV